MDDKLKKKLKSAFSKIKKDIKTIKSDSNTSKARLTKIEEEIKEIKALLTKSSDKPILKQKSPRKESSIGNEGVLRRYYDATTTLSQPDTMPEMKKDLNTLFRALTKQQFKVFSTIYTLEEDLNRSVTHKDIAKAAKLSQSAVRQYVSEIITKGIPLTKEKSANNQVFLSVPQEIRSLTLYEKLLKFHNFESSQRSLFD
tara:strand:+ start:234 stop:830 length:597 start_codon:yes stop_codon:yes gene_type:complete